MRDYEQLRKEMLKEAKKREEKIIGDVYMDEVNRVICDFTNNFDLSFDTDYVENYDDNWIQQTTRIPKMVGEKGYNVILDYDFSSDYDSVEDFVDYLIEAEKTTVEFLSHFKK